jgi:hypothetical protein
MNEEGWYIDPFGVHEARWFSDGSPTSLVRDGAAESGDEPPSDTSSGELTRLAGRQAVNGEDHRRSDSDAAPYDPSAGPLAAFDMMGQIGPGVPWHHKPRRVD